MEPIILASGSLRRHEYFRLLGLPFSIVKSHAPEDPVPDLEPNKQAEAIARRKVETVIETMRGRNPPWIFSADTVIVIDGEILGKPADRSDAERMLKRLSGREHTVVTGFALYNGKKRAIDSRTNESLVRFAALSEEEIEAYLATGEWQGVAGSYRIQGIGGCFISEIRGSYSSIVGLPLHDFYVMLRENGYDYLV